MSIRERYTPEVFLSETGAFTETLRSSASPAEARERLYLHVSKLQFESVQTDGADEDFRLSVVRDSARALRSLLAERSEQRTGFALLEALWELGHGRPRPDLGPGFLAELVHLARGLEGRLPPRPLEVDDPCPPLEGREAALRRSDELDALWARVEAAIAAVPDGLAPAALERRAARRAHVCRALGATPAEFDDWRWQVTHLACDGAGLARLCRLAPGERAAVDAAVAAGLPFGVTPYYASLFDDDLEAGRDRALRAQVLPPQSYVEPMRERRADRACAFDFMLERDTSPAPLVTRRYPAIAIFKPFQTCPQICVYCQRNWEIDQAMAPGALAAPAVIDEALAYLAAHPAICEVLVTGGDPLGLADEELLPILSRVAAIPHVEVIRIGTRTPVTLPMRVTPALAEALGRLREPGRREVVLVTHVEHPYELTPALVTAVDRLRRQGISVFNQLVFTFHVSRRFEAARLRRLLRLCGVDPYYTFIPKGKEETQAYRVPLARLLQEQKEEARLLPGSRRTDEAVYNVPGLGKNYLRAFQQRDLIGVLPDGSRVYDYHSWESGIAPRPHYVGQDVPILEYLERLEAQGVDPDAYASIWHYY